MLGDCISRERRPPRLDWTFLAVSLVALSGCSGLLKLDGLTFDLPPDAAGNTDAADEPAPLRNDVGVLPVFGQGLDATCPGRPGAYSFIHMDDQDGQPSQPAQCSDESSWVGRDVPKAPFKCAALSKNTYLRICRVSGDDFKNLSEDVLDVSNHYAVLMLGDVCPEGSTRLGRQIDNEDRSNRNEVDGGSILPNVATLDTKLFFCFFRGGPSTMTSFPQLGMNYSVFHDFDGEQPSWVLYKKWIHSDDEDSEGNTDAYIPPSAPELPDFMRIIESPIGESGKHDTTFDLAQVR